MTVDTSLRDKMARQEIVLQDQQQVPVVELVKEAILTPQYYMQESKFQKVIGKDVRHLFLCFVVELPPSLSKYTG